MNSYIKLIELNGERKFVPEIIDWVEDVDTDTTPEDVRDEFMQFVEENPGLSGAFRSTKKWMKI